MIEKRAARRLRVLKRGMIAFREGGGVDCTVRNLSTSGARVDVAGQMGLPAQFTLLIEADQFIRRCHPVWRKDSQIGLAFD